MKILCQLIKNWKYPAGKYKTTDNLTNKKGESPEELFKRRDTHIQARIQVGYPTLLYPLYMAIPTNGRIRRMQGEPKNNIGAVYDAEANRLILYRLTQPKEEKWYSK